MCACVYNHWLIVQGSLCPLILGCSYKETTVHGEALMCSVFFLVIDTWSPWPTNIKSFLLDYWFSFQCSGLCLFQVGNVTFCCCVLGICRHLLCLFSEIYNWISRTIHRQAIHTCITQFNQLSILGGKKGTKNCYWTGCAFFHSLWNIWLC